MSAKIRIRPESVPWLTKIHDYIVMFDMRGVDSLLHAASDALDGCVFGYELEDLRRRRLIALVRDDKYADLDELAGYAGGWSAVLTERAMCAFWPDRLEKS